MVGRKVYYRAICVNAEAIMLRLKGLTSGYNQDLESGEWGRELGNWREDENKQRSSRLERDLFSRNLTAIRLGRRSNDLRWK